MNVLPFLCSIDLDNTYNLLSKYHTCHRIGEAIYLTISADRACETGNYLTRCPRNLIEDETKHHRPLGRIS